MLVLYFVDVIQKRALSRVTIFIYLDKFRKIRRGERKIKEKKVL